MEFDSSRAIWTQLLEEFRRLVATGQWPPGGRIPAVRDLAATYRVNPNTVQRALSEFEREGLCNSQRTAGRFVTDQIADIEHLRHSLAGAAVEAFVELIQGLLIDRQVAIRLLEEHWPTELKEDGK